MTDKEIIIDGVDVSRCLAYRPGFRADYNCLATYSNCSSRCEASPNCYYKQLKRKEQDAMQQSKLSSAYRKEVINLREQLEYKEQKCEELKKEMDLYKTWYRAKHNDWCDVFFKKIKSNEKYKQALNKITKITNNISNYMNTGCNMDRCEECNHTKPYCTNQCVCYLIQQGKSIVDIINRALKDDR